MTSEVSVEPKARVDFKGRETTGVRFSSWPSYIKTRGFPESALGKESACNAGDPSLIPGWGRSTGDRIGYPLQYSWASLVAGLVKNLPEMPETWVQSNLGLIWVGKIPWRRERLPIPVLWPGEFHGLMAWSI